MIMPADNHDDIWGTLLAPASEQLTPGTPGLRTREQHMVFSGSTTLSEASYNKTMQTMVVKFKRSLGAYSYFDVPLHVAEQLFACEGSGQSAGKFFIREIKNVFPFKKII